MGFRGVKLSGQGPATLTGSFASALIVTFITLGITLGFSASVWAAACAPKKLTAAEVSNEVRKLQTTLMVAALSCGHRDNYNKFVTKFKSALQRHGHAIRSDFRKRYGAGGKKKLNKYVTALANEASQRSNADYDAFCADAGQLYKSLIVKKPKELGLFAAKSVSVEFGGTFKQQGGSCGKPKQLFPDIRKKTSKGGK